MMVVIEVGHPSYICRPMKYTLLRRGPAAKEGKRADGRSGRSGRRGREGETDRRVQAIAIGPIKYVTHDTMRCDREERVFPLLLLPAVRATFPISSDDRWITVEHLRQSGRVGRMDGANGGRGN